MKSKLLLVLLTGFTLLSNAQNGINSYVAPSQIALNSNASVTINYTSDEAGTYQFQVFPKNPDDTIDFSQGGTTIFAAGDLPIAPNGAELTSNMTDLFVNPSTVGVGEYIWFIKINVNGTDYFPSTNQLVSVVESLTIENSVSVVDASSEIALNSNGSVTINYVSDTDCAYQFQVFPKNPDDTIDFSQGGTTIFAGGNLPAAPNGSVFTSNLTDLFADESTISEGNYIWFIKITVNETDYLPTTTHLVSVVPALGLNSSTLAANEIYINYVEKKILINAENLNSKNAYVYDATGKIILMINNLQDQSSVDISNFSSGLYFIVTNDNRYLKFIL